ncbi:YopX family protein [Lactiplantibacillus plantarum]|uniref:YopX family protein n=1 Tax=Lactiplantibacillus plantarum TaxID=1590 RepID=UPI00223F994F|nr:YopX family protein [Lactiplantibacillus plantarum]
MIKFRAWDKVQNKMLLPDNIEFIHGQAYWAEASTDGQDECSNDGIVDGIGALFELEQFTGLKDVNGKEIYEGDIIQYSHQFYEDLFTGAIGRETGYIGTVVKNNGAFGILINRMSYTDAHSNYYHAKDFVPFCEFDDPEADMGLKGNVHENPDLLEADK